MVQVHDLDGLRALVQRVERGEEQGGIEVVGKGLDAWRAFNDDHVLVPAAGGVVEDERGRLLAIRRLGRWDLPKGKVEKDEPTATGALREVTEECGLTGLTLVRPLTSTWHTYERKGRHCLKRTDWFLMRASSTEPLMPQVEEEIEEVCWMDDEGVRRMEADTYPSLLPVLGMWRSLRG